MPVETGGGSPIGPEEGEAGGGSPITGGGGETGGGSPIAFGGDAPQPPLYFQWPFKSAAYQIRFPFDPAFPEDGGVLMQVQGPWPIAGPYRVRFRDQDGNYYGAKTTEGCYSGKFDQGDEVFANGSQQFIRFAAPKAPRGTYDLVVDWNDGADSLTALQAVRSVPRTFLQFTQRLLWGALLRGVSREGADVTVRYVPEQYPDFTTALLACVSGDEIVLDTNLSMTLHDVSSVLDNITVRAGEGKTPVLDHTLATTTGLSTTGDGWTISGIRFRSTVVNLGGIALFLDGGTGQAVEACIF